MRNRSWRKKIKEWLSRYFLMPLGMTINNINYYKTHHYKRQLLKIESDHISILAEFRDRRFQSIIQHCYNNVPFYRQYMDQQGLQVKDFQTIHDVIKLPIMDKATMSQNKKLLFANNFDSKKIRIDHTGGSTGTPTQFGIDKKSYYQVYANAWRCWGYAGYKPGMKMLLFWGNRSELERIKSLKKRIKSFVENIFTLNAYDFSKNQIYEYMKHIAYWRPAIIRGYSGAIYMFVELCKKYQLQLTHHPQAIIITSENILPSQKQRIAEFFHSEIFEEYGSREFGILAHECSTHSGLHLAEEQFIFEIYNPHTNQFHFEGNGEILISSLYNYGMPLLRYRIEDEGTIISDTCPCGRSLKLLKQIDGRIIDYIVTKNEKLIHQYILEDLFDGVPGIAAFQMQQFKKGEVNFFLILNDNFDMKTIEKMRTEIQMLFKDELTATFQKVDKIEALPSGKRQITISHIVHEYLPIAKKLN